MNIERWPSHATRMKVARRGKGLHSSPYISLNTVTAHPVLRYRWAWQFWLTSDLLQHNAGQP